MAIMKKTCYTYFELLAAAFPVGGFPPKNGLSPTDLHSKIINTSFLFEMLLVLLSKVASL